MTLMTHGLNGLKLTSLGLRMMLAAATTQCANWHYSIAEDDEDEQQETALCNAHRAEEDAGWAIIEATQRNPEAHLLDVAVLLRCRHDPTGGLINSEEHEPDLEDTALLCLLGTLLAQGGVNERSCAPPALYEAAKTSNVKPTYLRVRR